MGELPNSCASDRQLESRNRWITNKHPVLVRSHHQPGLVHRKHDCEPETEASE